MGYLGNCERLCNSENNSGTYWVAQKYIHDVKKIFNVRHAPPSNDTILQLVAKFQETGLVGDAKRQGRPRTAKIAGKYPACKENVVKDLKKLQHGDEITITGQLTGWSDWIFSSKQQIQLRVVINNSLPLTRLTGLGHWIGEEQTTGHATIWNKATENCPVLLMLQDSVEPTICPSPKLGIQIPSREDWDNTNNTICQNGIIWFTDGSKIGDKAGAGVYGKTTRTKLSFALGSYASVFQAEIYAILACGMEILKTAPKRRTIQICTDSQAALMAIESSKVKSRLVLDCKKILNDLASCNRVILT
ncbi:hypothetical protein NQ318_003163 [Aromia moschata]|uniref:RNase H type-1 domain-containing protein n=1 Tax=Aromia moschata TaxID=1265417 RepID=A0AAV8XKN6_9CUCU|nr:hypothetical protein NQ318_003163 [Aromia moschata]